MASWAALMTGVSLLPGGEAHPHEDGAGVRDEAAVPGEDQVGASLHFLGQAGVILEQGAHAENLDARLREGVYHHLVVCPEPLYVHGPVEVVFHGVRVGELKLLPRVVDQDPLQGPAFRCDAERGHMGNLAILALKLNGSEDRLLPPLTQEAGMSIVLLSR